MHWLGLPGRGGALMPVPSVVIIEKLADGVYLFRYTAAGEFGGDTWETVEEAQDQAAFEYEQALGQWYEGRPM